MPTYRFTINGLRHHDYADSLDRLFLIAPGRRVTLSVEADNPHESDAVIAHLGQRCLGYARSSQRAEACALIRARGEESLPGRIVEGDRLHRWLTLEVTTDCPVPPPSCEADHLPPLADWDFDGPVLAEEELHLRLRVMLSNLLQVVERCEPWEEDVEEWLQYVEQELWRDISRETSGQAAHLLLLLTGGATRQPAYADKTLRLQLAIERMGSPETRRRQVRHIVEEAHSSRMNLLLCRYGPDAADALLTLLSLMVRLQGIPVGDNVTGENADDAEGADERRNNYFKSASLCVQSPCSQRSTDSSRRENADNAEGTDERRNNLKLCASVTPCSMKSSVPPYSTKSSAAVRIAKGCKTKALVAFNAMYRAGWFADVQGRPLTNRDKALNDILRLAFGEEKPVAVRNLIWPSRNADNPERQQKVIKELLDSVQDEMD